MPVRDPATRRYIRVRSSGPYWYAKWRRRGVQVTRGLGPAWVDPDGRGGWRSRRGEPPAGALTEAQANVRMLELVREHDADQTELERDAEERRRRGLDTGGVTRAR